MFNEIKIIIDKKQYIVTECKWKKYKEIIREIRKFIMFCLKDSNKKS